MQKMPGHGDVHEDAILLPEMPASSLEISDDWRCGLPTLVGSLVALREMRTSDAPSLLIAMAADEVTRFISAAAGQHRGLRKVHRLDASPAVRRSGRVVCDRFARFRYRGRPHSDSFARAAVRHRGVGFCAGARVLGHRVLQRGFAARDARLPSTRSGPIASKRASVANARGNAALRKLGASREGILRRSFLRRGEHHDQALWTILAEEWRDARQWGVCPSMIH